MKKFQEWMEGKLIPVANAFAKVAIFRGISSGFMTILGVIMIGTVFSLFSGVSIGNYQAWLAETGLSKILAIGINATINVMALYTVFAVAYQMAKEKDMESSGIVIGFTALVAFFIVTPFLSIEDGKRTVIDMTYLGAQGLFVALIIGILTAYIFQFFKKRRWELGMPEGVPPSLVRSIEGLIPGIVVAILAVLVFVLFNSTQYGSIHGAIYGILGKPLATLSGSIWTWIVLGLVTNFLWFFGIHGLMVAIPFYFVLFMAPAMENMAAYAAGQPMQYPVSIGLLNIVISGGVGATLGLVLLITFFAKSARLKTLGKIALVPSLFNINEPIIFGLPMVLNPIMFIPFIFIQQIDSILAFLAMQAGLMSYARAGFLPAGTPVILGEFLQSGLGGIVFGLVIIVLNALLYYPFFRVQDKKYLVEEQEIGKTKK
jgi:PTS system cellobiose-specific IIC component